MKYFAEILSSLFNPALFFLIMPFMIVYRTTESAFYALKWEVFSIAFIAIAALLVFWGRKRGIFSDYDLSYREERYEFYGLLLFFGAVYIGIALFFKGIFFPMSLISIGIALGIVLLAILNRHVKASNHLAVASAFSISIGLLYGMGFFLFAFWIVPLVAWARLFLKKHTVVELITGGMLGVFITLLTFFIGRYMYR